jgi:hypothetical protein
VTCLEVIRGVLLGASPQSYCAAVEPSTFIVQSRGATNRAFE